MDRMIWCQSLSSAHCPSWTCPICKKGTVVLVPSSLTFKETVESQRAHKDDAWDPDWISYIFTAWSECNYQQCKQEFAISGIGGVEPDYDEQGSTTWNDYFNALQCNPMPNIITLPPKCPEAVSIALSASFKLFWSNQNACAGRIRVALECLMDSLGVSTTKIGKGEKAIELTLHGRIELFAQNNLTVGPQLMALKWLGNSGSHDSYVSQADLLDAFEIMEHTLSELIENRSEKVAALAQKLTKKHGY